MILRELFAVFGMQVDTRGFKQVENSIKSVDRQVQELGMLASRALAAGVLVAPFVGMIRLASDAVETLNVLHLAFGDNQKAVEDWADAVSDSVGRSRFELREMVGQMGNILRGQGIDVSQVTKISKDLTMAAMDISSAFNSSEERAQHAVQAALTGETVMLKRLTGITASIENMKEFAAAQGKVFVNMREADKTIMRYNFIMERLGNNHGDAIRTSKELANQWRRLRGWALDMGTELGLVFVPALKGMLETMGPVLDSIMRGGKSFVAWTKTVTFARTSLLALGSLIAATILPLLGKLLLVGSRLAAPYLAFALVIDDLFGYFEGRNSLIGRFVELLEDAENPAKKMDAALRSLLQVVNSMIRPFAAFSFILGSLFSGDYKSFVAGLNEVGIDFVSLIKQKDQLLAGAGQAINGALELVLPNSRSITPSSNSRSITPSSNVISSGASLVPSSRPPAGVNNSTVNQENTVNFDLSRTPESRVVNDVQNVINKAFEKSAQDIKQSLTESTAGAQ